MPQDWEGSQPVILMPELSKLQINNGDTVIAHMPESATHAEIAEYADMLAKLTAAQGLDVTILVVSQGIEISALNDEAMLEAGCVRVLDHDPDWRSAWFTLELYQDEDEHFDTSDAFKAGWEARERRRS